MTQPTETASVFSAIKPSGRLWSRAIVLVLIAWGFVVVTRVMGPSDLYDKEQPRTVAYTADMLVNGYWVIPHDTFGIPATKPPLFNWMSVPFVRMGGYEEWALKAPSVIASLAVLLCILVAGRRLAVDVDGAELAVGAALIWLASAMTQKLLYLARPDMLLTAFLMGAWLAATIFVRREGRSLGAVVCFWLCVVGAVMTKGTPAFIPLLYLPLAAKLIGGRLGLLKKSGWWWGLPLVIAAGAFYLMAAHRQEPEFFRSVLMGSEVAGHIAGPLQYVRTIFNGPLYVIARFLPWSLLVIALMVRVGPRKWFSHPMAGAILWMLLTLVCMSFVSTKRPDRYAPIFPPMALMAGYFVVRVGKGIRPHVPQWVAAGALAMIVGFAAYNQFWSEPAKRHYGERLASFAKQVEHHAGDDVILFEDGEMTPLETMLGRNQLRVIPEATLAQARWSVRFYEPGADAVAVSEPLPEIEKENPDDQQGRLALYRVTAEEALERHRNLWPPETPSTRPSKKAELAPRWLQRYHQHLSLPPATRKR